MINSAILNKSVVFNSPWVKILAFFCILGTLYLMFNQLFHQMLDSAGLSIDLINEKKYSTSAYLAFILHQLILPLIIIAGVWISWKLLYAESPWTTVGLALSVKGWKDFFIGIAISLALVLMVFAIEWALGWIQIGRFAWEARTTQQIVYSIYITGINWLVMAVLEELTGRGFVFQLIKSQYRYAWAIFISCVFSTVIYLISLDLEYLNSIAVLSIFLISALFSIARLHTEAVWMSIGMHFSWYFFAFNIFGLAGVNCSHAILFETLLPGPMTMVGVRATNFGPMGGLVTMAVIGAAVFFFGRFYYRNQIQKNTSDV